jgi:uncharacterized protein (DUF302 family)
MIVKRSTSGYTETVDALLAAIEQHGLAVFARIDHAAGAHEVDMELADEEVVLFGNPRGGTPLMQRDPRVGIELPLRILIWRDGEDVLLGYSDPRALSASYDLDGLDSNLEQLAGLLEALASTATTTAS